MLWRMLALILLWFVSFGQAQARSVYVLDSMACCRYDIAYMGALNTLKASGITVEHRILDLDHSQVLHDVVHKHPDAWMAIGTEATHFLATHIHNAPVIYSMVMNPSKKILAADNMRGIVLNPDADAMLQLLDDFNISAQHIGVLTGTTNHTDFSLQRFKHAAERREWLLDVWHVPNVTLLASHLDDFLQHHDALILFADRDVLTARTFHMIVQHCRKARVPLLAHRYLHKFYSCKEYLRHFFHLFKLFF